MDKVLVIGGSGFVGSHVADELTSRGCKVTLFDSKPSPWLKDDQEMIVGNMLDRASIERAMAGARYLYHFAGIADIGEASRRPYDTIHLNVMGLTVALEAAVAANIERVVYASTIYVYSPYGSFYRASKQAAETIIDAYKDKYGLGYTLLRYGSLYGPRAQEWNGLKGYINQIVRNKKLSYQGTGHERREYIHVLDAARLSVDILAKKYRNEAITLTGQQVLTSQELIDLIFEIADVKKKVEFQKEPVSKDHYTMTPYRYTPKQAKKIVPEEFIDIGQGVLDIVEEVYNELREEKAKK